MHAEPPTGGPEDADDGRESALSAALSRLESEGAAILVAGAVPPGVARTAGRRLLGRGGRRRVLVVAEGVDVDGLLADGADRGRRQLRVLRYPATTRSAAAPATDRDGVRSPADVSRQVPADAGALGRAVGAAIEDLGDGPASGDPRVWVGPMAALFDDHDTRDVVAFVRLLSDVVREVDGRVHFRLPVRHGDRRLAAVAGVCDATVRLRLRERPEMCWHFDDGPASGWVPLEWAAGDPR